MVKPGFFWLQKRSSKKEKESKTLLFLLGNRALSASTSPRVYFSSRGRNSCSEVGTWQRCHQHPKAVIGANANIDPPQSSESFMLREKPQWQKHILGQIFLSIKEIGNKNVLKIKAKSRKETPGTWSRYSTLLCPTQKIVLNDIPQSKYLYPGLRFPLLWSDWCSVCSRLFGIETEDYWRSFCGGFMGFSYGNKGFSYGNKWAREGKMCMRVSGGEGSWKITYLGFGNIPVEILKVGKPAPPLPQ